MAEETDRLWALVLTVLKFLVKGGGDVQSDRLCAVEFASENFINLNQSGQIAASRTVCG